MQKFHRGERRHQRSRLIQRFFQQYLSLEWFDKDASPEGWAYRRARRRVNTRKDCNCHYCVNMRSVYGNSRLGLTFQELRQFSRLCDEIAEVECESTHLQRSVKLNPRLRSSAGHSLGWRYGRIYSNYSNKSTLPTKP